MKCKKLLGLALVGFVFGLVFGCKNSGIVKSNTETKFVDEDECTPHDTATADGTQIRYKSQGDDFKIVWSNNDFARQTDSVYNCQIDEAGVWDFIPKVIGESKRYVLLQKTAMTSSGGNPAPLEFTAILLPKNRNEPIQQLDFLVRQISDYLVCSPEFGEIHLMNLNTAEVQDMELAPTPALIRTPTIPLDEVCIQDGILIVEYQSVDEEGEGVDEKNAFKINI